ncbi:V-type proton ATPase subunit H [Schizosaccharomyces pombe]
MSNSDLELSNAASPPPVELDNSQVDEIINNVRCVAIPWQGYQRSGSLEENELQEIENLTGKPLSAYVKTAEEDTTAYSNLFLKLLSMKDTPDVVNFALVKLADTLLNSNKFLSAFGPAFYDFLEKDESYINYLDDDSKLLFARVFALCSSSSPCSVAKAFTLFLEYLGKLMQSLNPLTRLFAVQCLNGVLTLKAHRYALWAENTCSFRLAELLRNSIGDTQLQYYSLFCFWQLTFESHIAQDINKRFDLIKLLVQIIRSDTKTKVYRLVLAILVNLIDKAPKDTISTMLLEHVDKAVQLLQKRKWADEDITNYLDFITSTLDESSKHLSTFDMYKSELDTGILHWSPSHRSEDFWHQNAKRLNEDNYALLKKLFHIVQYNEDNTSLAVACHDLGAYIRSYPEGRSLIIKYGAKQRIMDLMSHPDPEVRFEALSTVQLLMTEVWKD